MKEMLDNRSAADIEGLWRDADLNTGLIQRCKAHWNVPIRQLSDLMLATFLRQEIALVLAIPEARRRIKAETLDGSELYDGQLAEAVADASRLK